MDPNDPYRPTGLEKAAASVAGAAQGVADGLHHSRLAEHAAAAYEETLQVAQAAGGTWAGGNVKDAIGRTSHAVHRAAAETRARAEAVGEATRRARQAPGRIASDLKAATGSYAKGFARALAFWAVAGALGIAAFALFTVFLVDGLSMWMGAPWGALLVAVLYGIGLAVALNAAKAARARARVEAQQRLAHAQEEARRVARPMRRAFQRRPVAPETPGMAAPTAPPMNLNDLR